MNGSPGLLRTFSSSIICDKLNCGDSIGERYHGSFYIILDCMSECMQYFESPSYAEYCKRVNGSDMKHMGMITSDELALLFREVKLPQDSQILDMGCGAGHISAALAEHYSSFVIGVDFDDDAILYAKGAFQDNTSLEFTQLDYNEVKYDDVSFDMICFIDSLYFTFTREKLRAMLDKCLKMLKPHGRLVVFWTNLPQMFEMEEPASGNTQVGMWGTDNNVTVKAIELTEAHRQFWQKAHSEAVAMENTLKAELPEMWEDFMNERILLKGLCEKGNNGGIYRWLYIFIKQ